MLNWLKTFLNSSVGKKQIMALTGLALCGFLVTHLLGNLLLFVGAEAFNTYAHKLITNPLIIPMELGLLAVFVSHIGLAIRLSIENYSARPEKYFMKSKTYKGSTFASATMPYTGLIVLVFLILHLLHFKWGAHYSVFHSGVEMRDLYRLVVETFAKPGYVAWYVFAQVALGIHVSHGFASAFQSLGFNHPKYTPLISVVSKAYAVFITVGFSAIPIYLYIKGVQ